MVFGMRICPLSIFLNPLLTLTGVCLLMLMVAEKAITDAHAKTLEKTYAYFTLPNDEVLEKFLTPVSLENTLTSDPSQTPQKTIRKKELYHASSLNKFYEIRDYQPFWVHDIGGYQFKAQYVLRVLENSWKNGLNPDSYHVQEIKHILAQPFITRHGRLELLLSDGLMRYGSDLTGMRIEAKKLRQRPEDWRQPLSGEIVLHQLLRAPSIEEGIAHLEPKDPMYGELKKELASLVEKLRSQGQSKTLKKISMKGILEPKRGHKSVPYIRQRVAMHLGVTIEPKGNKTTYDRTLAGYVEDFQSKYSLDPDGIIGPKTVALLNKDTEDYYNQVIANMERLRWQEQDKSSKHILVNIPSAMLYAYNNGRQSFTMPVIVGKTYRPTRSFKAEIEGVRFNPTWTIPPTIKRHDIFPKIVKDMRYLKDQEIALFKGYGRKAQKLVAKEISWDSLSWRELSSIRMVQAPGPKNPLGEVRVIMRNPFNIYLHDTNHPEYFEGEERARSSGCIRMSDPQKVANFILEGNEKWSRSKMRKIIRKGDTKEISATQSMPVFVVYQTIWKNEKGTMIYGHDLYGEDKRLLKELAKIDGIFDPTNLSTTRLAEKTHTSAVNKI